MSAGSESRATIRLDEGIAAVQRARRVPGLVVLEGFHPLKHAIRFGAEILGIWTADEAELDQLRDQLAPDLEIPRQLVDADALRAVAPRAQVVAVARRPRQPDPDTVLAGPGHVVLLEDPRHLGNLGAAIRVAAAAGAAGVLTTGRQDPWHADALRGSAGLHFSLPVHRLRALPAATVPAGDPERRALVALDPEGESLLAASVPPRALLAFGTERDGLSPELLARADHRVGLPMRPGVSSLNLATAVAATLYVLRLAG